jgi:hypothetical protein
MNCAKISYIKWEMFLHFGFCMRKSQIYNQWNRALKNVDNCMNNNIYSYLEISDFQSSNLYLNGVHFFNATVKYTSVAA